ncbi:MAG: DUF6088 family protein [Opitutaceae bacterium]|nr:hypothetical protein [Opitutaceae bacterium]
MSNNSQSVIKKVISRIYGRGKGCVLSPSDFIDLGSRDAIDQSLHRLTKLGTIRRIARGLYHYPESHTLLGEVAPSIEAVTKAMAASEQVKLQPSGAYAANLLGLSEQVPAKVVFLTSGRARKVKLGKLIIELRPTTPRRVASAGRTSGLVLAALRYLGQPHVTPDRIAHLQKTLSAEDRRQLLTDLPSAPAWLHRHLRTIAAK